MSDQVKPTEVVEDKNAPIKDRIVVPDAAKAALSPEDQAVVDFPTRSPDGKLTDADVIDMSSLFQTEEAPAKAGEAAAAASTPLAVASPSANVTPAAAAPTPAKRKFNVRGREFESLEAVDAFLAGLDQSQNDLIDKINPITETPPVKVKPEEVLFEDPKKAFDLLRQEFRDEQLAKERQQREINEKHTQAVNTWSKFYNDNPDLRSFEEIVEKQHQLLQGKPEARLPIEQGLEILAKRSRDRIQEMKAKFSPAQELSSSPARAAPSTSATVPVVKSETDVTNFITELKNVRNRGKLV